MSEIQDLIKELNIPEEKLIDLAKTIQNNPFGALAKIQELAIPPEFFQRMMAIMMSNPQAITDFAKKAGATDEQISQAQEVMQNLAPKA